MLKKLNIHFVSPGITIGVQTVNFTVFSSFPLARFCFFSNQLCKFAYDVLIKICATKKNDGQGIKTENLVVRFFVSYESHTVKTCIQEPRISEVRQNRFLYFRVVFHNSG